MTESIAPGIRAARLWLAQIRAIGLEPDPAAIERITVACHRDRPCNDCAAPLGGAHGDGCDVARCLHSGGQRLVCDGFDERCECEEENGYDPQGYTKHSCGQLPHECGEEVWEGMWPGYLEAVDLGIYAYFDKGWHWCAPEHPQASPDLNTLQQLTRWDKQTQRRVALPGAREKAARRLLAARIGAFEPE